MANVVRRERLESTVSVVDAQGALRQAFEQIKQGDFEDFLKHDTSLGPLKRWMLGANVRTVRSERSIVLRCTSRILHRTVALFTLSASEGWSRAQFTGRKLWFGAMLAFEAQPSLAGCTLTVTLSLPRLLDSVMGAPTGRGGKSLYDTLGDALHEWERMAIRVAATGSIKEDATSAWDQSYL